TTITTIQALTPDCGCASKKMNVPQTMILSANGSRIRPRTVIRLYLRAMYPSTASVAAARRNTTTAGIPNRELLALIIANSTRARISRVTVIALGTFHNEAPSGFELVGPGAVPVAEVPSD